MFYPEKVFSKAQEAQIVEAIRKFERLTSGEIRVHVEHRLRRPPVDEARRVFQALKMNHTKKRNGVLFLLAPGQRSFAVFGDIGIDEVTTPDFWQHVCELMHPHLASGSFVEGLSIGIEVAGKALAKYFPFEEGDVNELPDDISYG